MTFKEQKKRNIGTMTLYCDVVGYQCFGGLWCLHFQGEVNDAGSVRVRGGRGGARSPG